MAQRVKQVTTRERASVVQDGADTDAPIPGSFPQHRHDIDGTNRTYSYDSHSSSSLADDEGSSAGSSDEADGELR